MKKDDNTRNTLDRNQAVVSLTRGFEAASHHLGVKNKAIRDGDPRKPGPATGSTLYNYQVDFAYLLDEITRGHEAAAWQAFAQAKQLISEVSEAEPSEAESTIT